MNYMKSSTTNNPITIPSAWCGSTVTTSGGVFTTITPNGMVYGTGGYHTLDHPKAIHIGGCRLEEIDNELYWVRPDGTKTRLTGKGKNFDNLYDKLNNPE